MKLSDYYDFELAMYPYFNASHTNQSPKIKYRGEYIVGEWYCKYLFNGNSIARFPKDSFKVPGAKFLKWILEKDKEFTDHIYSTYLSIIEFTDRLEKMNYEDVKKDKIRPKEEFYDECNYIFGQVIGFAYPIDTALEEYAKEKSISSSSITAFGISFVKQEEKDLQKLTKQTNQKKKEYQLREHALRYSYVLNNYTGYHPAPIDYFRNRLNEIKDKPIHEDKIAPLKKPETIEEWIGFFTYIRDVRKRCNMIFNGMIDRYLKSECKRLNLSYEDAVMLIPEEFEIQKLTKLRSYKGVRYIRPTHSGIVDISKNEWDKLVTIDEDTTEVKGIVASNGKAEGFVKVIFNPSEFHKLNKGDIIVTSMTRPEFAPILNKAAAIVTNEGSITCHAAIISRELKIPCIISTGNATRALKDGDYVEVDANAGVVRVLKKKKEDRSIARTVKDFELTFEGQGMPYIYEIALYKYYLPRIWVSIIKNGVVQEFMYKDTLVDMNREGLVLTSFTIKALIQKMDSAVKKSKKEIEQILKEPLTSDSLKKAFENAGKVTNAYYFFDPHFFDGLFAKSHNDSESAKVVEIVQKYKNVAREYFNQVHFGDNGDIPRLLSQISKKSRIPFDELQNYNEDELTNALKGVRISKNTLLARKELYVMERSDDGTSMSELVGEEAEIFCRDFYATKDQFDGSVLKGKIANAPKSIVRGIVKCITRDYNDVKRMYIQMDEMKEGEILVTQTTDPEMMPALRKAAAAVTDIGGMLSHTAITARELGIPCIVDTKFATQFLKDGDYVEVDATKGIVRKIKQ